MSKTSIYISSVLATCIAVISVVLVWLMAHKICMDTLAIWKEIDAEMDLFKTFSNDIWKELQELHPRSSRQSLFSQTEYYAIGNEGVKEKLNSAIVTAPGVLPEFYGPPGSSIHDHTPYPTLAPPIQPRLDRIQQAYSNFYASLDEPSIPSAVSSLFPYDGNKTPFEARPPAVPESVNSPEFYPQETQFVLNSSPNKDYASCKCSVINKCPAGPAGEKGRIGSFGYPGVAGPSGTDGVDAPDVSVESPLAQDDIEGACAVCPAGLPGRHGLPGQSGLQGQPGITGSHGILGRKGLKGPHGLMGHSGFFGTPGKSGYRGVQGTSALKIIGLPGTKGFPGRDGENGLAGFNGQNGANGLLGKRGKTGYSGVNGTTGGQGNYGHVGEQGKRGTNYGCICPRRKYSPL